MFKFISIIVLSFWVVGCTAQDANYYRLHPRALQDAIQTCPSSAPSGISCDALHHIAMELNAMASTLRRDPQAYGQAILSRQEAIAKQMTELEKNPQQLDIKTALDANKKALEQQLAIVKWLESPES